MGAWLWPWVCYMVVLVVPPISSVHFCSTFFAINVLKWVLGGRAGTNAIAKNLSRFVAGFEIPLSLCFPIPNMA